MSSNLPLTDDLVRELFERRATGAIPADLGAEILAATAAHRQLRHWWERLGPTPDSARRTPLMVAVALLVVASVAGGVLVVASRPGEPEPLPVPSPASIPGFTAAPASTSQPTVSNTPTLAPGVVKTSIATRGLEYRIPDGLDLQPVAGSGAMLAFVPAGQSPYERDEKDRFLPGTRGVTLAATRAAVTHPCPPVNGGPSRVPIREPADEFIEDLRTLGGAGLSEPAPVQFDGRPAIEVRVDPSKNRCEFVDFHVSGGSIGSGYVVLDVPSRLILTRIDDTTMVLQVWAATQDDLEAWLPAANEFLDTITLDAMTSLDSAHVAVS